MKAKAVVRAELDDWRLGDSTEDPGEVLLKLVTQSSRRCSLYADLLQRAYQAAEELQQSPWLEDGVSRNFDADELKEVAPGNRFSQAQDQLFRIFNLGGVAALVGVTWGAAKDVGTYQTGEAIRGLADLEMKERRLCAEFATKAVAAGLAERQVRVAERQGEIIATIIKAALSNPAAALTPNQLSIVEGSVADQLMELATGEV